MGCGTSSQTPSVSIAISELNGSTCYSVGDFAADLPTCGELYPDVVETVTTATGERDGRAVVAGVIGRPGVSVAAELESGKRILGLVTLEGTFVLESKSGRFVSLLFGPQDSPLSCVLDGTGLQQCGPPD